jgi:hypothetical protein
MNARHASRIRIGTAGLLISGLFFAACILLRGPNIDPNTDPAAFARAAATASFPRAWYFAVAGQVIQIFGFLGLYAYLAPRNSERSAFAGTMLCLAGAALVMPLFAIMAFIAPTVGRLYLQGETSSIQAVAAYVTTPISLAVLGCAGLAYTLGCLLVSVALWKNQTVPRSIAILYTLQAPLLAVPITFSLEIAGALFLTIAGAVLTAKVWKDTTIGDDASAASVRPAPDTVSA